MPIVNMNDMLHHAYLNGYAVGSFDLINLNYLKGIILAAERTRSPVILSLSEPNFKHSDIELLMPAIEASARKASIPVAIHLDLSTSLESAIHAINLGCNGIMVNASYHSKQENFDIAADVVEMAHGCGVSVEGKLNALPFAKAEHTNNYLMENTYNTSEDIREYLKKTGIDLLDVSFEIMHDNPEKEPGLDFHRLQQINEALGIPLVIQGGIELTNDQYSQLFANGVAKINVSTSLSDFSSTQINKDSKNDILDEYDNLAENIVSIVASQSEHYMQQLKSVKQAEKVLAQCHPWTPVEHLIIYNVQGLNKDEIKWMISEGHRVLSTIPGVREVFAGEAVNENAGYRYTWLVRFCHPSVIDSYRVHHAHTAFADKLFRPVAGERISIDFQTLNVTDKKTDIQ